MKQYPEHKSGNTRARLRMTTLYYFAALHGRHESLRPTCPEVDGRAVRLHSPQDAAAAGIDGPAALKMFRDEVQKLKATN